MRSGNFSIPILFWLILRNCFKKRYVFFSFFDVIRQVWNILGRPSLGALFSPINCQIPYVFYLFLNKKWLRTSKDLQPQKLQIQEVIVVTSDAVNRSSPLQVSNRSHYISKRCGKLLVRLDSTVKLSALFCSHFTVLQESMMHFKDLKSALLGLRCRGHQDVNLSSRYAGGCISIRSRTWFCEAFKWVESLLESAASTWGA